MGEKKDRFKVWRVRKAKKEKEKKSNLPDRYPDGSWHLLLLKNPILFIQA
jgi:hypothetical protein